MRETIPIAKLLFLAARAGFELARARVLLSRIRPGDIMQRNARVAAREAALARTPDDAATNRLCGEMAFAITRMALRVPWRSDCLVQALAGQNWLARQAVASEIVVGTARGREGTFEAHAWLSRGSTVLLGGNVDRFNPLLGPAAAPAGEG
ncbi:MAG: lasso peptide biosynthesis B2 protein [Erythrobacter sp.]